MNSQKYKHKKQIQATESFKKTQVREKQAKFRVKTARLAHSASESLPLLCNTRPWTNTILTKRDGDNRCSDYALNAFLYIIIMIFYCVLMVHITDTRAQKVVSYTSAHITETVFAHDQHWEEQSSLSSTQLYRHLQKHRKWLTIQ